MPDPEFQQTEGFSPSPHYRNTLRTLFDVLFDETSVRSPTESASGFISRERSWVTNNRAYVAVEDMTEAAEQHVKLYRALLSSDGFIELRIYVYGVEDGTLQVSNDLFTPRELERFSEDEVVRRDVSKGIVEGFEQGFCTPSDIEYMEFVEDAASFERL